MIKKLAIVAILSSIATISAMGALSARDAAARSESGILPPNVIPGNTVWFTDGTWEGTKATVFEVRGEWALVTGPKSGDRKFWIHVPSSGAIWAD